MKRVQIEQFGSVIDNESKFLKIWNKKKYLFDYMRLMPLSAMNKITFRLMKISLIHSRLSRLVPPTA